MKYYEIIKLGGGSMQKHNANDLINLYLSDYLLLPCILSFRWLLGE